LVSVTTKTRTNVFFKKKNILFILKFTTLTIGHLTVYTTLT
jgi:hypothetical protein